MSAPNGRSSRIALLTALTALPAVVAAGCGLDADGAAEASDRRQSAVSDAEQVDETVAPVAAFTSGVVEIEGETRRSLTPVVVDASGDGGIRTKEADASASYARLCQGEIDVVDAFRPIEDGELEECADHGLEVVQLQVAADAAVVAIAAETDVGGDCLSVTQVEDIYRAGSPILSWADLGLDQVPLRAGGPGMDSAAFEFFSLLALRADTPSLTYYRSDYHAFEEDLGSRRFVTGSDGERRRASSARTDAGRYRSATDELRRSRSTLALARSEYDVALAERDKGIVDQRPPSTRASDQERLDAAKIALRDARAVTVAARTVRDRLARRHHRSAGAVRDLERRRGNVGYFGFSYYELFEDQLRPFEITVDDDPRNCIFPSEWTVTTGSYPLAQRFLLTTTTRSLARPEVQTFLDDYLGSSRELAADAHLVPMSRSVLVEQRRWVRGESDPAVLSVSDDELADETADAEPVS